MTRRARASLTVFSQGFQQRSSGSKVVPDSRPSVMTLVLVRVMV